MTYTGILIGIVLMLLVLVWVLLHRTSLQRQALYFFQNSDVKDGQTLLADFEERFSAKYIAHSDYESFVQKYDVVYHKAKSLCFKMRHFGLPVPDQLYSFITSYEQLPDLRNSHNKQYVYDTLREHKDFFDHCLTYPLDHQQRNSIVPEEDNCLVVSSAGSGKTSSIVGKVRYLIEKRGVQPENILLISFTRKAANELSVRMNAPNLRGYTFHKLALDIIGKHTGKKPSVCENNGQLIVDIYRNMIADDKFKRNIATFFIDYDAQADEEERLTRERQRQLADAKETRIVAGVTDMDGHHVYVRSHQEARICFALSALGVDWRYEEPYEHDTANDQYSQYHPDFSIHYKINGIPKRLYLEHFGINSEGNVPKWFASKQGITYAEANKRYNDGIEWKKVIHRQCGTRMISTSSVELQGANVTDILRVKLQAEGVPLQEKSADELYLMMIPNNSSREKMIIRLAATFISLLKSNCKTIDELLHEAQRKRDIRTIFVVKNIFQPIFEQYKKELHQRQQIDFNDAIAMATDICNATHPVKYDYIIVDEFQDISIDRYHFLKALRNSNPPAKLYCVGDDWQSIYRFSGSDMTLFSHFEDYFGKTDIHKIESTYRFGEPAVSKSSAFIQRNHHQINKAIRPFNDHLHTDIIFQPYSSDDYCSIVERAIAQIPAEKSVFLIGRYNFDDWHLSQKFPAAKDGEHYYYTICDRKVEFLTVHKSKGLEADYAIILQCNDDTLGFPAKIYGDPVLNYLLSRSDDYPYAEERRCFYVATTRAKEKTIVLYDEHAPSVFIDDFIHPNKSDEPPFPELRNHMKRWTQRQDRFLLQQYNNGHSIKRIAQTMGRTPTAIIMRLEYLTKSRLT
ncbi:MAG: UvrD-helicase domain-containing protein [Bacteroidales bacterium]|nr:UvrD-helicase domain-containing protein [Bacteroidales bacterium]